MAIRPAAGEILSIDIVEVNASSSLREAITKATKSPKDVHLLLDTRAIPILQGIGTRNDLMLRECQALVKTIYDNSMIVLCPREEAR